MKNKLIRTFLLPLMVLLGLGALMFLPELEVCGFKLKPVNLLSDVGVDFYDLEEEETPLLDTIPVVKPPFQLECPEGVTLIDDYSEQPSDSACFIGRGMNRFYELLGKIGRLGRPVRIAYFGDSFIEGDILTDELRGELQSEYGGSGVGFVDIASATAGFRQSVRATSKGWSSHCITDSVWFDRSRQGIAERYYLAKRAAWVTLNGIPAHQRLHQDTCAVSQILFRSPEGVTVTARINGGETQTFDALPSDEIQALGVRGKIGKVTWSVADSTSTTFFGVTMDGEEGIILDNYSLRGSSGLTIRTIPDSTLIEFNKVRPYDLVVLQFGLNVAKSNKIHYGDYENRMQRIMKKLAAAFPEAGFLIVSVSDRGENRNGEVVTMRGIEQLVSYQQQLAFHTGTAFWNMFQAMGGKGSMAQFADTIPALANKDYTHLNFRGGRHLGNLLFKAIKAGKKNYEKRREYEAR